MILVTFVAGVALNHFMPEIFPILIPPPHNLVFGGILLVPGIFIIFLAKREFIREKQPSAPGKPTTKIVMTGVFQQTRNPLYLGVVITVAGVGLALKNIWIVVLDFFLAIAIHMFLIIPEEKYLIKIFPLQAVVICPPESLNGELGVVSTPWAGYLRHFDKQRGNTPAGAG